MDKFINFKVRAKNKVFWVAFIPAVLVLVQSVCAIFGFTIDLTGLQDKLLQVVEAVFVLLAVLGVVVDPTTPSFCDSEQALSYIAPGVIEEPEEGLEDEDGEVDMEDDEDEAIKETDGDGNDGKNGNSENGE